MARKLSREEEAAADNDTGFLALKEGGRVRYVEEDAEKLRDCFATGPTKTSFDCVWISEALSHLPDKQLFFTNASLLLRPGGKLVVADWFKAEDLTAAQMEADIKPIEGILIEFPA